MAVQVRPSGEPITAGLRAAAGPVAPAAAPPTASQPDGPCATPASCPAFAWPTAAGGRAARRQLEPPSAETHSAQPRLALPTATSVAPLAAIADTSTGRPPPPKSAAASRAGGNPAASADGAAASPPLFAPSTTTPATPTAIAATSGAARL